MCRVGRIVAASCFLKVDGIGGESQDARHQGEIELLSFSWGEAQLGASGAGGGGGAGKVQIHDLHFTATMSKASPQLMQACASGQHLKSAVLSGRRPGKSQQDYLVITLSDVLVSSYQVGAVDPTAPVDQVALSFARITLDYRPQKADGSLDAAVHAGWDVKANKKI